MSSKKHFSPEEDDPSSKTSGGYRGIRSFQKSSIVVENDANDLEGVDHYNSAAKLLISSTEDAENHQGIQLDNLNKNSTESGSQSLKKSSTLKSDKTKSSSETGSQKTKRPNKPLTKVSRVTYGSVCMGIFCVSKLHCYIVLCETNSSTFKLVYYKICYVGVWNCGSTILV